MPEKEPNSRFVALLLLITVVILSGFTYLQWTTPPVTPTPLPTTPYIKPHPETPLPPYPQPHPKRKPHPAPTYYT